MKLKSYESIKGKHGGERSDKSQQEFFDPLPRVMKIKINKWDLIKLKSFCTAKEIINKTKGSPQNGRKYLQMMQLTKD